MIEIQTIPRKGRGVVSRQKILDKTLIESSPASVIPPEQIHSIDKTEVFQYYFVRPDEYARHHISRGYLVFGLASLCNHSDEPNAQVHWVENEVGLWCHLVAQRDIHPNEEITLFYTNFEQYIYKDTFV